MLDTQQNRQLVLEEAITWIKTPFHCNANLKGVGVDCGHFLAEVYRAVGIEVPEVTEQFRIDWHLHERTERYLNIVSPYTHHVETPMMGDIVMFKIARVYGHSAIIVNWPTIIHARWGSGVEYCDVSIDGDLKKRPYIFLSPFESRI